MEHETGDIVEAMGQSSHFPHRTALLSDNAVLCYLAFAKLIVHLAVNLPGGYGYFRDELYYIACSDHMAWGYVDHPPFSIAALWVSRLLLGDSLLALRLLPAVAGAIVVGLAGLVTRELGGKRFAQVLSSCCVAVAPLTLGTNSVFSMNSFDVLFWTLALYLIVVLLNHDEQRHWSLLGVVLGLGLLNKISVLWLCAGVASGLLLSPHRRPFLTRRLWIAAAVALIHSAPYIVWEVVYGFPTLEFIRNATGEAVIRLGGSREAMLESYREATQVAFFRDEYCMPYENNMPIFVCKGRRTPLKDDRAEFKHYE